MQNIRVKHEYIVIDEDTGKEYGRTDDIKKLAAIRREAFIAARKEQFNDPKSPQAKAEKRRINRLRRIRD